MKQCTTMLTILIMLAIQITSCSVPCNSVTCDGYVIDVVGSHYKLNIKKQYFNTEPQQAKDHFINEFQGQIFSLTDFPGVDAQLNHGVCSCD